MPVKDKTSLLSEAALQKGAKNVLIAAESNAPLDFTVKFPFTLLSLPLSEISRKRLKRFHYCRLNAQGFQIGAYFMTWASFKNAYVLPHRLPTHEGIFHVYCSSVKMTSHDEDFFAQVHKEYPEEQDVHLSFTLPLFNPGLESLLVMLQVFQRAFSGG